MKALDYSLWITNYSPGAAPLQIIL